MLSAGRRLRILAGGLLLVGALGCFPYGPLRREAFWEEKRAMCQPHIANPRPDLPAGATPALQLTTPQAWYPPEAEEAGREGCVVVKLQVDADGAVQSFEVLGGPEEFWAPTKAAASLSRFEPAMLGNKRIPSTVISRYFFLMALRSQGYYGPTARPDPNRVP